MADTPNPVGARGIKAATAARGENQLFGIFLRVISTLCFAAMNLLVKLLSVGYPTGEVIFARSFFALVPILGLAFMTTGVADAFRTRNLSGHAIRTGVGVSSMTLGFMSISLLPLASATAIGYATPLITVVLGAVLLGETVRLYRWTAVLVGLAGVVLILSDYLPGAGAPQTSGHLLGAAFALAGTLFGAFVSIQIRHMHRTETSMAIVTYFSAFCALIGFATLALGLVWPSLAWKMPDLQDGLLLIAVGLIGGVGQVTLTQSLRHADVSSVAPFSYLALIWAIMFGYLFFSDIPTLAMVLGSAIVIASGIFVVYRERQLAMAKMAGKGR